MPKNRFTAIRRSKAAIAPPATPGNRILAALPPADFARIAPQLENIPVRLRQYLRRSGEALAHVHFPSSGFLSELTVLTNGEMVEVSTIGREGMAGWTAGFNGNGVPSATMVQADMGTCHRMTLADFNREMDRRGRFYELVSRYRQAVMAVVMQSTACNAVHSLEQRLARWLLMAGDRIGKDDFSLTQEFVAMMLGASRPTVSIVSGALQKSGVITYRRGRVRILSRPGLELVSCECYAATVRQLARVTA